MAKFNKENFFLITKELEKQEENNENFGLGVGILETMYEDDFGGIDYFFHSDPQDRNIEGLGNKLNK